MDGTVMSATKIATLALLALYCSACELIKASPAKDTGFLPHAELLTAMPERSPFNGSWYADRDKFYKMKGDYRHLLILPVRTDFLVSQTKQKVRSPEELQERAEEIEAMAAYMQQRFVQSLENRSDSNIKISEKDGPKTFVLELSLAELIPTEPAVNAVATAAGFFVPGGGAIRLAASGSIAMEAIVRDGVSGDILFEFKDRQVDKTSPFSIKDFQRYAHSRKTIDEWADIFAELIATSGDHKVEGASPLTLDPF